MRYLSSLFSGYYLSNSLSIILLSFFVLVFISCKKEKDDDEENGPQVYLPELTLQSPDSTNFTIGIGETFFISVTASINAQSTTSLTTIRILHNYNGTGFEVLLDSTISEYGYIYMLNNYACLANEKIGIEIWKIIVYDNAGGADSLILSTEVVDINPVLNFMTGEFEPGKKRINEDTTLTVGQEFVFGIDAITGSSENLRRVIINRCYENVSTITVFDSSLNSPSFNMDIQTVAYPIQGNEEFLVTVWDESDRESTISFTITTIPNAPNITIFEDRILGAQNSVTGIAFATADGVVYTLSDAKENAADIDFLYYYGATNMVTLAAPDDATAAIVYNNSQNGLQTWDVLNNTRFKLTTLSGTNFNDITSSIQILTAATLPSPPDQSQINNLAVGDVLAFETWDQKYGLIHINNIATGAEGSIDITVKVQ